MNVCGHPLNTIPTEYFGFAQTCRPTPKGIIILIDWRLVTRFDKYFQQSKRYETITMHILTHQEIGLRLPRVKLSDRSLGSKFEMANKERTHVKLDLHMYCISYGGKT